MDKYEMRRLKVKGLISSEANGVISSFAEKIDKNASYVSRMLYPEGKSGKKRIGDDMCEHIQTRLGLGETYFYESSPAPITKIKQQSDFITIQQCTDVSGSMGSGVTLRDQPGSITSWDVTPEWASKNIPQNTGMNNIRIITGFGDSMRGMFNSGDPLIVDTGVKAVEYDAVYFFRVANEGFIKRLQRVPGRGLVALSENKAYESWAVTDDMDFEVFARVLKVWKSEEF